MAVIVVKEKVCDVHRDEKEDLQRRVHYDEGTGFVYVFDACKKCQQVIDKVLGPILSVAQRSKEFPDITGIRRTTPIVKGVVWAIGVHQDGRFSLLHATEDRVDSLCGQIAGGKKQGHLVIADLVDGTYKKCQKCTQAVKALAKKQGATDG